MHRSRSLANLVERLSHCTYGEAYRTGLKPAQWSVLRYFSNANRFSKTTSAFARYQGITLGAASQTIGVLVDKRLLQRRPDKTDRRRHQLTLTARAEKLIHADPISSLVEAAFGLGDAEKAATADGLERMLGHLMRQKGGACFGSCDGGCRFLQCTRRQGRLARPYRCAHLDQGLSQEDLTKICINFAP